MRNLFLALGLAAAIAHGADECVVVDGDRILAADFARASAVFAGLPAGRPLAYSPTPGAKRLYSAAQLRRLARQHRLTEEPGTEACFARATSLLTAEKITDVLRRVLGEPDAHLEVVDYSQRPIPRGEIEFTLAGLSSPSKSEPDKPVLWRGAVRYGGRRSVSIWARVRLSLPRVQVVALCDLSPGILIGAGDVIARTVEAFPEKDPPLAALEQAVGRLTVRRVRAGEAIFSSWLKLPNDVERDELVEVKVTSGLARLLFSAKAESSGHLGESVWVRNPESGKRFTATVVGRGQVEVRVDSKGNS